MPELKTIEIIGGLMNVSQVAEFLGVPKSTIYNLSMQGKIPHYHVPPPKGRLLKFKKSDIDKWLSEGGCDGKGVEN